MLFCMVHFRCICKQVCSFVDRPPGGIALGPLASHVKPLAVSKFLYNGITEYCISEKLSSRYVCQNRCSGK